MCAVQRRQEAVVELFPLSWVLLSLFCSYMFNRYVLIVKRH